METKSNPCIRCGKERIKGKEKTLTINNTETKITAHVCPDKDCQKKVEADLLAKEERKLRFSAKRNSHPKKKIEDKTETPPKNEVPNSQK